MDLTGFREDINGIDDDILRLLARRRQLVRDVIQLKEQENLILRDAQREEDLLGRLIGTGRQMGLDAHTVTKIFHEIIDDSVRWQQLFLQKNRNPDEKPESCRVAFQGISGNFSHQAAGEFFAEQSQAVFTGYPAFSDVVQAVEEGHEDYGLLPFENTTAGGINEVYDELLRTRLSVIGEHVFQIRHCLLAIEQVPLTKIRRVLSQWQALAQCTRFLSQLQNCQREPVTDTATAARNIKEDQDLSQAAIASEEAARQYDLVVLARDIADQSDNFTRFVIVGPRSVKIDPRVPAKTSLIMATADESGALLKALVVLDRHGVNMTRLESRPKRSSRFEYLFYVDVEGNRDSEVFQRALNELRASTSFLKILGSYPAAHRERTAPAIEALVSTARAEDESSGSEVGVDPLSDSEVETAGSSVVPAGRHDPGKRSLIYLGGVPIGSDALIVLAGPRQVESVEQIRRCARHAKECGARILFGGCRSPLAAHNQLSGLDRHLLSTLATVARDYDLPAIVEVTSSADIAMAAESVDGLIVGGQNMQHVGLLTEVGSVNLPVVLTRGPASTIEQLLAAAECIMSAGNQQIVLCEQGVRTFGTTTHNALDLGAVDVLRASTHLPVVVNPSQAAGRTELAIPLALAARAVDPHGLMLEIDAGGSGQPPDGSLTIDQFAKLMRRMFRCPSD